VTNYFDFTGKNKLKQDPRNWSISGKNYGNELCRCYYGSDVSPQRKLRILMDEVNLAINGLTLRKYIVKHVIPHCGRNKVCCLRLPCFVRR